MVDTTDSEGSDSPLSEVSADPPEVLDALAALPPKYTFRVHEVVEVLMGARSGSAYAGGSYLGLVTCLTSFNDSVSIDFQHLTESRGARADSGCCSANWTIFLIISAGARTTASGADRPR